MSWFRVDDKLHGHRKARRAGAEAMGLWVMCGSYLSASNSEDGRIELDEVEAVALTLRVRKWEGLVDRLVDVGLWDREGNALIFHDWTDYRPTGEAELERRRAADRARKEAAREAARSKRESEDKSDAVRGTSADTSSETSEDIPRTGPESSAEGCPHPRVGSPDPSRPDPLHTAQRARTPGGQVAWDALRSHPSLAAAADPEFGDELAAMAEMAGTTPLLAGAVADAAAKATAREIQHDRAKLRELLTGFVRHAKPRQDPAPRAAHRGPPPKQPPPEDGAKARGWGKTTTGD